MKRKPIAITIMIFALLFGAWSNVIAAAFCPRFASDRPCCEKHSSTPAPSHSMEDGEACHKHTEQIEGEETSDHSAQPESESLIAILAEEPACTHCFSHSQTSPARASATAGDPGKSSVDLDPPVIGVHSLSHSIVRRLTTFDHGPPGEYQPRYILNSAFRI